MHLLLALLRHIHRELYLRGPELVPVVLSKYKTASAVAISLLCAAVALYDLTRRRWGQAAFWLAAAALLDVGFQATSMLWPPQTTLALGSAAIAAAVFGILLTLRERLQNALARAREERRALRHIPGVPPRPRPVMHPGSRSDSRAESRPESRPVDR